MWVNRACIWKKKESISIDTTTVRLNNYKEKEICGLTKWVHKKKESIYIATNIVRLNYYTEKKHVG